MHYNRFYFFYDVDDLYCKILRSKKEENITVEDLEFIKKIDSVAYPKRYRAFENIVTIEEFVDACFCSDVCQLDFYKGASWYLLIARHYNCIVIISFASVSGVGTGIYHIVSLLQTQYPGVRVYAECREISWKLLEAAEKQKRVRIIKVWMDDKEDEEGYQRYVKFLILPKRVNSSEKRLHKKKTY